jgi:hypothetical protein
MNLLDGMKNNVAGIQHIIQGGKGREKLID